MARKIVQLIGVGDVDIGEEFHVKVRNVHLNNGVVVVTLAKVEMPVNRVHVLKLANGNASDQTKAFVISNLLIADTLEAVVDALRLLRSPS